MYRWLRDWIEDHFDLLVLLVLGALGVVLVASIGTAIHANGACLAHGFPNNSIDWRLQIYCVKRVNQTDVVVPLEQLP